MSKNTKESVKTQVIKFNVPGIDPATLKVVKNQKYLTVSAVDAAGEVYSDTYIGDFVVKDANYKWGQLFVTVAPPAVSPGQQIAVRIS